MFEAEVENFPILKDEEMVIWLQEGGPEGCSSHTAVTTQLGIWPN